MKIISSIMQRRESWQTLPGRWVQAEARQRIVKRIKKCYY